MDSEVTEYKDNHRGKSAQDKLGDPSGQSGTEYWDEWFQTVSAGETFEWYTSPSEVIRILTAVLNDGNNSCNGLNGLSAIHVGSGNSMLPIEMAKASNGKQVVLDCSQVALDEMKQRFDDLVKA